MKFGAVLLAGGASRRFGADNKLLLEVEGVPLLRRGASVLLASGAVDVVVVTGFEHARYLEALRGLPVRFVQNAEWAAGIGGSVATGIRAISPETDAAFIVPGDMPRLDPDLLSKLMARYLAEEEPRVVVPVTNGGAQRNPVLWPAAFFESLASCAGPRGAKEMLPRLGASRVDVTVDDDRIFADIDTAQDCELADDSSKMKIS
jgi:molybdenum cofactor cytidylyltransferase